MVLRSFRVTISIPNLIGPFFRSGTRLVRIWAGSGVTDADVRRWKEAHWLSNCTHRRTARIARMHQHFGSVVVHVACVIWLFCVGVPEVATVSDEVKTQAGLSWT